MEIGGVLFVYYFFGLGLSLSAHSLCPAQAASPNGQLPRAIQLQAVAAEQGKARQEQAEQWDDSITLSLTDTQDGGLLWCDFPEALPAHLAGVAPTTRSFPASLPFHPPDADTTRCLPTSNAANASYHQAASTDESTGALSDKPSAGGKENKRPPTQQVTTHLMLVCQANMCNAQFAWTTHAQQHFSQTKRPEPRFCQACQDKRRIKNQRELANSCIKKK